MATQIEYALMAGASYISTRAKINQFPVPKNWTKVTNPESYARNPNSGFEAIAFTNGSEIVISYAGTDPGDLAGDVAADLALAAGYLSNQLRQAADYYLQIKAANPGASISFTGHSLGGGLASLMAVLFGENGTTFDQAPFLKAAQTIVIADPQTGGVRAYSAAQELRDYLAGHVSTAALIKLDAYIVANALGSSQPNPADTLAGRNGLVSNTNTQGEFLTAWYLVPSSN